MWTYFDSVGLDRSRFLTESPSFDDIVTTIFSVADIVGFERDAFQDKRLKGCARSSFLLKVTNEVYDLLFNGTRGLRAQYAESPVHGALANRRLVDIVAEKLMAVGVQKFNIDRQFVRDSLAGQGAKIWVYEPEVHDQLFDNVPEINFDRWTNNSTDGVGLRAPQGTKLVVAGGWLDEMGREHLDPYKKNRSQDIYDVGFA